MVILSTLFLLLAIFISVKISQINDIINTSYPVGDLFFDIIPRLDLSLVFVGGESLLIGIAIFYAIFCVPEKIPLAFFTFTLFVLIRAFCISLTHVGVPIDYIAPSIGTGNFFYQNDLFFSGHTGGPFLVALLLWEKKILRYIILCISVVMAFTVISMRLHYSIDIVGAYFITYGIFRLAEYFYTLGGIHTPFLKSWFLQFNEKKKKENL